MDKIIFIYDRRGKFKLEMCVYEVVSSGKVKAINK